MKSEYRKFLDSKAIVVKQRGMENVPRLAGHLFPFQKHCVEFALRAGSAGNFLSTGLAGQYLNAQENQSDFFLNESETAVA